MISNVINSINYPNLLVTFGWTLTLVNSYISNYLCSHNKNYHTNSGPLQRWMVWQVKIWCRGTCWWYPLHRYRAPLWCCSHQRSGHCQWSYIIMLTGQFSVCLTMVKLSILGTCLYKQRQVTIVIQSCERLFTNNRKAWKHLSLCPGESVPVTKTTLPADEASYHSTQHKRHTLFQRDTRHSDSLLWSCQRNCCRYPNRWGYMDSSWP